MLNVEYYKKLEEHAHLHEAVFGLVRVLLRADTQIGNVAEDLSNSEQINGFTKEVVTRFHNDRYFLREGIKYLYTLVELVENDDLTREECILREMLLDIENNKFDNIERL